ncbi:alanine:cation symporter family protein [Reichenbachiella carrageenanivorans]|uniref:Alanine:cation symporter family protein n=1 Tax=Reichenbachiella carrageenanivorans TaxID=2979869 RepID=A0ABY6D3J9_9BACT|nr:alanine/glycine:cation symporter family protein [Reichenbachiella carrageenanivorans]UXX80731.1 alanine:cation symporter family protein [Reichenbachiella carrageenanivorans]
MMLDLLQSLENFFTVAVGYVWGMPLLILLLGGGVYFTIYARFLPFRYFKHGIDVLRGKYDNAEEKGEISHFQALSGHLAATVGMGNISGVALAIVAGGPGAIFWMWISALLGITTKFFTCSLAVMYRGKDSQGDLQGGPMYVIREGMPKVWKPLAAFFCVAGLFGATPIFQANQIVQVTKDVILRPMGMVGEDELIVNILIGLVITFFTALVIFGGLKRIADVASKLVPAMVVVYGLSVLAIMIVNASSVWTNFFLIFEDAFTANAVLGGAVGAVIIEGAKRAAFSNEAGIGTAPMMHGAAKTDEPIREGLVAMLGPVIDTMIVCTMTGLCILSTGVWQAGGSDGITLTAQAFESSIPYVGHYILFVPVLIFAFTTVFGMAYYGKKCFSYLFGAEYGHLFNYWYVSIIVIGSVWSLDGVVNLIFVMYGLMAIPTMISAIYLSPKVLKEAKRYFSDLKA